MNSDFYPPAYGGGGSGCSIKAFALLSLMFLVFILFASSSLAQVDLTPDTPPAYADTAAEPVLESQPQVISIQDSPLTYDSGPIVPITGGCTNPYTVQPGDVLSGIAVKCDVSLADLRLANPEIANANLIYPGQPLRVPGSSAVLQQTPLPVTGDSQPQGQVILEAPDQQAGSTIQVPVTGPPTIAAGTRLHITGLNFPANTPVNFAIGPGNGTFTVIAAGMTDASGSVFTVITVPASTNQQSTWVVVIATSGTPSIQARSEPFYIGASAN